MRDTYSKVDGGDGGVVLKSIADVSCSFISNIVALHQSINQSINEEEENESEWLWLVVDE